MGEPHRDPANGPGNGPGPGDPHRPAPPASPPPSPGRPAPNPDPLGAALGPILGTVSATRPPSPSGSGPGTASQVQFEGNQPVFSGGERQVEAGAFPATRFGGYVARPGGEDVRVFAGVSDGPTTFAFAGRQDTGAFGLGLRLGDATHGVAAGYARNPQAQAGFVRLDADRLQLTAQGSFTPNGNQYTLDGRYRLDDGRSITANGAFNDGTRDWRAGLGYTDRPGGTHFSGALTGSPQGLGGSVSVDTQLAAGLRGGAQGAYQPNGTWNVGPRFNLELGDGWRANVGANVLRDAQARTGGNVELGISRFDERSGMRLNFSAGVDTFGGYSGRIGVTLPLDSIFGGGERRSRTSAPPPPAVGLPEPAAPARGLDRTSAVSPPPGDAAAAPQRSASAAQMSNLLDAMGAGDRDALAAARNHPAGQELRAQAVAEADRQQAQQVQPQVAQAQEPAPEQANPSRGARSLG